MHRALAAGHGGLTSTWCARVCAQHWASHAPMFWIIRVGTYFNKCNKRNIEKRSLIAYDWEQFRQLWEAPFLKHLRNVNVHKIEPNIAFGNARDIKNGLWLCTTHSDAANPALQYPLHDLHVQQGQVSSDVLVALQGQRCMENYWKAGKKSSGFGIGIMPSVRLFIVQRRAMRRVPFRNSLNKKHRRIAVDKRTFRSTACFFWVIWCMHRPIHAMAMLPNVTMVSVKATSVLRFYDQEGFSSRTYSGYLTWALCKTRFDPKPLNLYTKISHIPTVQYHRQSSWAKALWKT